MTRAETSCAAGNLFLGYFQLKLMLFSKLSHVSGSYLFQNVCFREYNSPNYCHEILVFEILHICFLTVLYLIYWHLNVFNVFAFKITN